MKEQSPGDILFLIVQEIILSKQLYDQVKELSDKQKLEHARNYCKIVKREEFAFQLLFVIKLFR